MTTRDGGEYVHAEPVTRGAAERALTDAEIVEKYDANATLAVSPARAEAVKAAVLGLDETDGPTLARTLAAD